jgi:hypothetical protein
MSELLVDISGATLGGTPVQITFDLDGNLPLMLLPPDDTGGPCFTSSPLVSNFNANVGSIAYNFHGPATLAGFPSGCLGGGVVTQDTLVMDSATHSFGLSVDTRAPSDLTVSGALATWSTGSAVGSLDDTFFQVSDVHVTSVSEPAPIILFAAGLLALLLARSVLDVGKHAKAVKRFIFGQRHQAVRS